MADGKSNQNTLTLFSLNIMDGKGGRIRNVFNNSRCDCIGPGLDRCNSQYQLSRFYTRLIVALSCGLDHHQERMEMIDSVIRVRN